MSVQGLQVTVVRRAEECPSLGPQDQAVVVDVLRATSSMAAAVNCGVGRIWPVISVEEARRIRAADPVWLLVGERANTRPAGFDRGNSPLEWTAGDRGASAVWTTTNGTRALFGAAGAGRLAAAGFVNRARAARWAEEAPEQRLVLIPAGEKGRESEEDWLCCGAIVEALHHPIVTTEAARAREAFLAVRERLLPAIQATRHGQALVAQGLLDDVQWAARLDLIAVLPARIHADPLWLGPS
jgi:2-phosphosulfolactate phosphatase